MIPWNCVCGARDVVEPFCTWCGRRDPGPWAPPPPGQQATQPAPPQQQPPQYPPPQYPQHYPPPNPQQNPYAAPQQWPPPQQWTPPQPQWGAPPPQWPPPNWGWAPPPPPRVGLTPAARVLTALLSVLLVAGLAIVERRLTDPFGFDSSPRIDPVARAEVDRAVERGRAFIERFRGKPFVDEVEVTLLDDEEFTRELLEDEGGPSDEEDDFGATLHGLGLADAEDDVDKEEEELLAETVVGFYDDTTGRLVVRGTSFDASAEMTLVHELAHAWQDQQFDLYELWDDVGNEDEAMALRSLVEGDARRVELAWLAEQPEDVRNEVEERIEDGFVGVDDDDESRATQSLDLLYSFPYQAGRKFAKALHDKGGNAALDAAFASPPVSSAQILHPELYTKRVRPRDVPEPPIRGKVVDRGRLGEAGLIVTLAGEKEIGEAAFDAAEGWAGDQYVTWQIMNRTCTAVSVALVSRADRDELVTLLRKRPLGKGGGVEAVANDRVEFVSCEG